MNPNKRNSQARNLRKEERGTKGKDDSRNHMRVKIVKIVRAMKQVRVKIVKIVRAMKQVRKSLK